MYVLFCFEFVFILFFLACLLACLLALYDCACTPTYKQRKKKQRNRQTTKSIDICVSVREKERGLRFNFAGTHTLCDVHLLQNLWMCKCTHATCNTHVYIHAHVYTCNMHTYTGIKTPLDYLF